MIPRRQTAAVVAAKLQVTEGMTEKMKQNELGMFTLARDTMLSAMTATNQQTTNILASTVSIIEVSKSSGFDKQGAQCETKEADEAKAQALMAEFNDLKEETALIKATCTQMKQEREEARIEAERVERERLDKEERKKVREQEKADLQARLKQLNEDDD